MKILKKLLSLKIAFLYNFELFYYIHEIVIQSSFNYTNTSGIHIKPEKSVVIEVEDYRDLPSHWL